MAAGASPNTLPSSFTSPCCSGGIEPVSGYLLCLAPVSRILLHSCLCRSCLELGERELRLLASSACSGVKVGQDVQVHLTNDLPVHVTGVQLPATLPPLGAGDFLFFLSTHFHLCYWLASTQPGFRAF